MKERMRNELLAVMSEDLSEEQLRLLALRFDEMAVGYDVQAAQLGLAVLGREDFEKIIKTFLVVKGMEGMSRGTLENYAQRLRALMMYSVKPLGELTVNDLRLFLFQYQQDHGVSNRTLESIRISICAFMRWAALEDYIAKDPAQTLKPIKFTAKPRRAMTQVELEMIRRACQTPRETALVETLYSTGCRVSELTGIKLSDLDWNRKTVTLFGKGQKYRTSYINAKAEVSIRAYLRMRKYDSIFLFCNDRGGGQMTKDNVERMIKKIAERAGLGHAGITPHVFRHTTATQALYSGMPVEDIQQLLGHATVATTMVYAHVDQGGVQEKHKKYIV